MELKQLNLFPEPCMTASQIPPGNCFFHKHTLYMRVKPVNILLNSNLISDICSRGDIIAVNIEKGILRYLSGKTEVEPATATCTFSRDYK